MKIGGAMPKIVKRGFVCAALAIAWVAAPSLRAQDKKELLPAPLPAQIFTARKIFVSNAGDETLGEFSGGPDRAYNQLYTALKGWGRYELVAVPADAALVFEISFAKPLLAYKVSVGGAGHASVSSTPWTEPHFPLALQA